MKSADAIKAIKERISLADLARRYVNLRPNGTRLVAPCPFHQETKPSFSIDPDKGFFYCFGCHASGDLFDFYAKINGMDFRQALEQLALETGVSLEAGAGARGRGKDPEFSSRRAMLAMHELAARHFGASLRGEEGGECRAYVAQRGLSPEIMEKFGIGWAQRSWDALIRLLRKEGFDLDQACEAGLAGKSAKGRYYDRFRGRLIFPIKSLSGQTIAFGGRIIASEDEAKYINSADTPIYTKRDHLYGLAQARRQIAAKGRALLTEGYMDVLTLHQFGHENGVGVLGTALTEEQIRRLCGFTSRITLIFDGDGPGRKAALRACEMLLSLGVDCSVVLLPDGEDIDSLLRGPGEALFGKLLASAPEGLAFCAKALAAMAPRDALDWARRFLAQARIPELASRHASFLAQTLGLSEAELRKSAADSARPAREKAAAAAEESMEMRERQILAFAVRHPERLADLREMGAHLALRSPHAARFWEILDRFGEEADCHLDERQKNFWLKQRGPEAAPRDRGDMELDFLRRALASFFQSLKLSSLSAALADRAASGDFGAELEYLRALQETLEKHHEQS